MVDCVEFLNGNIKLFNGDCLEVMDKLISDGVVVDAVITDPPYGTTACKWDSIIPFNEMWGRLNKLIKPSGAIVLFGSQPFTSVLIASNISKFKYEWIWQKAVGSNFATLKYQPMKEHENIIVFSNETHNYYPVMQERAEGGAKRVKSPYHTNSVEGGDAMSNINRNNAGKEYGNLRNPSSVQYFNNREATRGLHPTQKPVALMEYLIKTYTNENEVVLDFTMGSCTTGGASINTNRKFIGIELDKEYFKNSCERIQKAIDDKESNLF